METMFTCICENNLHDINFGAKTHPKCQWCHSVGWVPGKKKRKKETKKKKKKLNTSTQHSVLLDFGCTVASCLWLQPSWLSCCDRLWVLKPSAKVSPFFRP